MILAELIKLFGEQVLDFFKTRAQHKAKIKEAEVEAKIIQIQTEAAQAFELNKAAVNDWGTSWKDEFLLIIFSIPIIGVFIPALQPYIYEGFNALQAVPDWYKTTFMGITAAVFGLRGLNKWMNKNG